MGKWNVGIYKLSKILLLAALIGMSLTMSISPRAYADENPIQTDSGDGDDTDFAKGTIVRTQT